MGKLALIVVRVIKGAEAASGVEPADRRMPAGRKSGPIQFGPVQSSLVRRVIAGSSFREERDS